MYLICSLSNFDPIDHYRVAKSGILTAKEAVQAKTIKIYWVSQKICQILKLKFEVLNISMRKMVVSHDSRKMYKSFGTSFVCFYAPDKLIRTGYFAKSTFNKT